MNENETADDSMIKINTAKMNCLFTEDNENKNKAVIIKGKDNITALWKEFEEIFRVSDTISSYIDLRKIEFNHFLIKSKKVGYDLLDYDKEVESFIKSIPNPGVRELISSYINQRPSMLFTILDDRDDETMNQIFLCESKRVDGVVSVFPMSHKLHNNKSISYIRKLEKNLGIRENGSWIGDTEIVENEVEKTYFTYESIIETLSRF